MPNTVYILGAGASKDFGLPLGIELFDCAHKLSLLNRFDKAQDLGNLLAHVEKYMAEIFTNVGENKLAYPPLEEVLTFLWDYMDSETFDYRSNKRISIFDHPKGARGAFDIFAQMLGLTLAGAMQVSQAHDRIRVLTEFIKSLLSDRESSISFISLNYDVLLDNVLNECVNNKIIDDYTYGIPLYNIAEHCRYASSRKLCRQTGILLLKPHGSLNLVCCSHHPTYGSDSFYYSQNDPIAADASTRCPACGAVPKPLLIPPLYNKGDYVAASKYKRPQVNARATLESYRQFCDRKINEVLGQADEITVIGYSLPAYDYDFKSLLMTSLIKNTKRKEVHLRLITKGDETDIAKLTAQFKHLVGSVTVAGAQGFYDFLTQCA